MAHVLTVDLEDWYHTTAVRRWAPRAERIPRLPESGPRMLDLLDEHGAQATFFVLGEVARDHPGLVREVAARGHEVACHGDSHRLLGELTPRILEEDLRRARGLLEDLAGARVEGYRAPTWSLGSSTLWALDVLQRLGFRYDSSLHPVPGLAVPGAPRRPYRLAGTALVEVPPLTLGPLPVAGGFWLRALPAALGHEALRRAERRGVPGVLFFHPWEIDPGSPLPAMPLAGRVLQGWRRDRSEPALRDLLERWAFAPARSVLRSLGRLPAWDPRVRRWLDEPGHQEEVGVEVAPAEGHPVHPEP